MTTDYQRPIDDAPSSGPPQLVEDTNPLSRPVPSEQLEHREPVVETVEAAPARGVRLDRIIAGILVAAIGVGWLVDEAGASVPWRLFPAAALILVGLGLAIVAATGLSGRASLIGLGVVLLLAALVTTVAGRYVGPVGDRMLAPTAAEWPVDARLGAGTLTIDLTRNALPDTGTLDATVGAGKIVVLVPDGAAVRIDARVSTGEITVNGESVRNGVDVRWRDTVPAGLAVVLDLQVGAGQIEVHHV